MTKEEVENDIKIQLVSPISFFKFNCILSNSPKIKSNIISNLEFIFYNEYSYFFKLTYYDSLFHKTYSKIFFPLKYLQLSHLSNDKIIYETLLQFFELNFPYRHLDKNKKKI